jgi:L-asparaginase
VAVCAGTIHSALDVQKVHTYKVDAFSSGDAGPLGYVEEGRVRLLRSWQFDQEPSWQTAMENVENRFTAIDWPRVEIIMNYAGVNGTVVNALVACGVQGLVVAATGNGTLHHALESALLNAQAAGVKVVRATRCPNGRVLPRPDDRLPDSNGLSPVKARVELMLQLMTSGSASAQQRH